LALAPPAAAAVTITAVNSTITPVIATASTMGNKHSLQDDLITFKLTSKQFIRDSKKCEKNQAVQKEKLVKAIKDGNMEGARIYGQNVIREKNQALNFLRMASRIDAVASRLETAIRMQDVSKVPKHVARALPSVLV
jgi:charged multivesicular body protein 1